MKIEANLNNKIYFAKKKKVKKENKIIDDTMQKVPISASAGTNNKILASIYAIKKSQEVNRLKQELIKAYDLIYEEMAQEAQEMGLDFIKPKLEFRNIPKDTTACHLAGKNKIIINTKKLSKKAIARYTNGFYSYDILKDGKQIPYTHFTLHFGEKLGQDCKYITGDEKLFVLASSLAHELTHAKQEQFMLSASGSVEKLYEASKKKNPKLFGRITLDDFKKLLEFYDTYKPKTTFEHNEKRDFVFRYLQDINGNRLKISYSPDDVIKYNVEYDSKDLDVYYNNPLEIEARAKQIDFYINYKKYMPNIKIDKDIQDYYIDTLVYICHTLLSE